jgi:hypothetical protein
MNEEPFAPPPFKPQDALVQLRRTLRDLKLGEHGNRYELRGKAVVELRAEATALTARLARKPALTPEWDVQTVKSAADQRKLVDEVKKRLARWEREE